mgnify:CR=1 FL=1
MKKLLALLLAAMMVLSLAACGGDTADTATDDTAHDTQTEDLFYAVEAGSAGEAAAEEKGFTYNSVASQADALMEVAAGTSDAAIIDLLMAGAMIGEGTSYPDLIHTDELTTAESGVGCRHGTDLAAHLHNSFADTSPARPLPETAATHGTQDALVGQG